MKKLLIIVVSALLINVKTTLSIGQAEIAKLNEIQSQVLDYHKKHDTNPSDENFQNLTQKFKELRLKHHELIQKADAKINECFASNQGKAKTDLIKSCKNDLDEAKELHKFIIQQVKLIKPIIKK